ncbi:hypothetical protein [Thermocoleostomius sinensis]|uniref:Uncharacterized protein n=1 Tax=Thermocoleostomius sinensis A174 TaxID=2016057 RepID=A0A9E8ZG75_9CYAN|nr:hypothetical protein [Thermocoleostomius sinensis]WAL61197.1 hypothetical protein OXH18_04135 [Thermocoleostomius sinensis A174]
MSAVQVRLLAFKVNQEKLRLVGVLLTQDFFTGDLGSIFWGLLGDFGAKTGGKLVEVVEVL